MEKRILDRSRIRAVEGGFAFIPHRFLMDGFIKQLESGELLLYLFLALVSDAYGLSYYGDSAICRLLKTNPTDLEQYRQTLLAQDLIAYDPPLYQVLELPHKPVKMEKQTRISSSTSSPSSSFSQLQDRLRS